LWTSRAVASFPMQLEDNPSPPSAASLQAALRPVDGMFGALLEATPDALVILGSDHRIFLVNAQAEVLFGYSREALVGEPVEKLMPERFRGRHAGHLAQYFSEPQVRPMGVGLELYARHQDGTEFPVEISLSPLETPAGRLALSAIRDVTERRKADARFRSLLETMPDPIVIADAEGRIFLVNQETERVFGYSREELIGEPIEILLPERFRGDHVHHRSRYRAAPTVRTMGVGMELAARRKDGSEFPVEISLSPLETDEGLLITSHIRDVTEPKRADEERARLLESEQHKSEQLGLAIREAHHRIKNNLQAITDLLSLELASADDSASLQSLRDSIERIGAIAVVHDFLSRDRDLERVEVNRVVERLVPMVLRGSGLAGGAVAVEISAAHVALPSRDATALALVVNELVSNAAKHAFGPRRRGRLQVRLEQQQGRALLAVQDDGPGLLPGFDLETHSNVGLQVVATLVRSTLRGNLVFSQSGGICAEVRFPVEP